MEHRGGQEAFEAKTVAKLTSFGLLVAAYISLNSSLNLLNKWSLGIYGFKFPFMLTACHMAFSFLALAPVALRTPWAVHKRTLEKQWQGVVCIGAFMAFNIVLNNASLVGISLTLNQIIRSALPVVTCFISMVVEKKFPNRQEVMSLVVLSIGVMLAVWQGSLAGTPHAIVFCMASVICSGLMMCFASKLMSEKLDVVRLTFYTAPVSLLCLVTPTYYYERDAFLAYLPHHYNDVVFLLGISSVNAVAYNLVHSLMIKATSAVTTTVLGEVKIVGLLMLSALVLGESKEFTLKMTIGCVMALIGFCMYSHTKILRFRQQLPPSPLQPPISLTANGATPLLVADAAVKMEVQHALKPSPPKHFNIGANNDGQQQPMMSVIKV